MKSETAKSECAVRSRNAHNFRMVKPLEKSQEPDLHEQGYTFIHKWPIKTTLLGR